VQPADPLPLLLVALVGVASVVLLITWVRLPAFLGLAIGSIVVGLGARMPLAEIPRAFQQGMGDTLGFIAMVIGLGTVMGKLLAESGGAVVVSSWLVRTLGTRRLDWAMMLSGFIIGLPVFFQVGLVLLAPVLFTLLRQTGTPLVRLGVPLVAGLSAVHGLTPPHPGPLAAIERLGADTGGTLFYSLIVALPAAIVGGPLFGRFIGNRIAIETGGMAAQLTGETTASRTPSLAATLTTILLPVLLMLFAALAQPTLPDGPARRWIGFAGSPLVAMLLATLVLLVVGAGGGFGRVLDAAGVDTAIADAMSGRRLSPLILGWVIAALLRLSVGSATVACVTAASIMAPIVATLPEVNRELLVVAIGTGSLIASHVNDGGFWLVKEYFNMNVAQTVATWTTLETIIAVAGLGVVLIAGLV
jgi:GntP family gluconate:H+ symporter